MHTESWNSPDLLPSDQCRSLDMQRLKAKVDAGADFIITQFFFDTDGLLDWVRRCRSAGISCPILPGPWHALFLSDSAWAPHGSGRVLAAAGPQWQTEEQGENPPGGVRR